MAQMVPTTMMVASWTSRQNDVRLDFYSQPTQYTLFARLFQKNVTDNFVDTGITIPENQMTIETKSLYDLMRGDNQKVFNLTDLSPKQKEAIMGSLSGRNITVERNIYSASIVIHALS